MANNSEEEHGPHKAVVPVLMMIMMMRGWECFLNAVAMKTVLGTIQTHILLVLKESFFESKVGGRLKANHSLPYCIHCC
jgi:hypothetical protein